MILRMRNVSKCEQKENQKDARVMVITNRPVMSCVLKEPTAEAAGISCISKSVGLHLSRSLSMQFMTVTAHIL